MLAPILLIAFCALALLAAFCVRRIPVGQVYTLRRRNGQVRTLGPGLHLVWPVVEQVAHKISLSGSAITVDDLVHERDAVRATVYFQVLDPGRADRVIDQVHDLLRDATRRLFADVALPAARDERRQWLKRALNGEVRERGLLIARVDLVEQA